LTLSSQGNQFTVHQVDFSDDIATRVNIKKRRETVVYKTLSSINNINIAYLMGTEVNPSNNLFISDRGTSLPQNRIPSSQDITILTTKSVNLSIEQFLITDQFTTETATAPETPLFYAHTLEGYNSDLANFSNMTLLSIEFADQDLNLLDLTEYVLDSSTGVVYNNIENSYDATSGSFEVTYVKYTVRSITDGVQSVTIHHELVSNDPVYTQASFDDIDEWGLLLTDRKKYLIETNPGGASYLITFPTSQRYAYREIPESRLKVLTPTAVDITAPWYVRVSNGNFIASLQKTAVLSLPHKYHVAEFNSQLFMPYPPYKLEREQKATWLASNLIYVPKNIVIDSGLGLFADVIIKNRDRELQYAYSNDPDKIGTKYEGTTNYTDGILSYDKLNGFIELSDTVLDDDIITVSYYTEESQYEFSFIDFNPVNNMDILNRRTIIYVAPETSRTGSLDASLHYLTVNTLGEVVYASQTDGAGTVTDPGTQKMLSEDFFTTGAPKYTIYYDKESTSSGLGSRVASGINPGHESDFSFIDKYTVESVLLTSPTLPSGSAMINYEDNPRYLVLADIYVGESEAPGNLSDFDIRVPGGGIKDDNRWDALKQQAEAAWYWDFNTNRPYPGADAFMVEIPQTVLEAHGGDFTTDQVDDIVERHIAMGGYAVVKTYGVDPVITDATVGSGHISISWPSYGSSVTYNVYQSREIDIGFAQVNSSDIADVPGGNNYTASGLIASTKYYLKLGAVDANYDESFGTTVAVTTSTAVA
jgi:hypothetical protein